MEVCPESLGATLGRSVGCRLSFPEKRLVGHPLTTTLGFNKVVVVVIVILSIQVNVKIE